MGHELGRDKMLKSEKVIASLFKGGKSVKAYPIKLIWSFSDDIEVVDFKMAVSVPKRKFKKAVERNRIKRLIRESFRLNNSELKETLHVHNKKVNVFFIYMGSDVPTYQEVEGKIILSLLRLKEQIQELSRVD